MYRPRLIPVVLVAGWSAFKTIRFNSRINLGDPVNIVSIFNTFNVDELVILDIEATIKTKTIDYGLLRDIASEAQVPFSVGGGVKTLEQVSMLLSMGAEKVIISSAFFENPSFVREAVHRFGSSSISVCMDVKRNFLSQRAVYSNSGRRKVSLAALELGKRAEEIGAGEIIVQSIDRDGMMSGYDNEILSSLSSSLSVPVVALGGAGSLQHMLDTYATTQVSAFASGSFFVFSGPERGVLLSYPDKTKLDRFKQLRAEWNLRV